MALKNYLHQPAIGQKDQTLCWAACLSWWLKAARHQDVQQEKLRDDNVGLWTDDGTILDPQMKSLINKYGMTYDFYPNATYFLAENLQEHLDYGPVYIAYTETSSQLQHVNVIYNMTGSGFYDRKVAVMEPQAQKIPDQFGLDSGKYIGQHQVKNLREFNRRGAVHIGSLMWCV